MSNPFHSWVTAASIVQLQIYMPVFSKSRCRLLSLDVRNTPLGLVLNPWYDQVGGSEVGRMEKKRRQVKGKKGSERTGHRATPSSCFVLEGKTFDCHNLVAKESITHPLPFGSNMINNTSSERRNCVKIQWIDPLQTPTRQDAGIPFVSKRSMAPSITSCRHA